MQGVVKIIFARDIPGENTFTIFGVIPDQFSKEKLFADDQIDYAGQAIGLVIAKSFQEATKAAKAVKITYKEIKKPILNILDAIEAKSFFNSPPDFVQGDAENAISKSAHQLQNEISMGGQIHYFMENHVAICEPYENCYE